MRPFFHQRRPGGRGSNEPSNAPALSTAADTPATWFGWSCLACVVDSAPIITPVDATHLAGVHDLVFHGGKPTASVTDDRDSRTEV